MARAGKFPRGLVDDAAALKNFVIRHPDLVERCGVTEDKINMLLNAAEGVQDG